MDTADEESRTEHQTRTRTQDCHRVHDLLFAPCAIWMFHVPQPVRMASAFVRSSSLKSGAPDLLAVS